jgi:peptidoglycan hydrolase-like protein with peptidoglycan-binding domain
MATVRRKDFIEARLDRQLDLKTARNDPRFLAELRAAGFKPEDLDKLDLYGHDGVVRGPREMRALFDLLKAMDAGGDREALSLGTEKKSGWTPSKAGTASQAFDTLFESAPKVAQPRAPTAMPNRLALSAPVEKGGVNARADVLAVQTRLKELGLDVPTDGKFGLKTEQALRVYRGMLTGTDEVTELPGRIEPGDVVHQALGMDKPPAWVEMPKEGPGFVNVDTDHFGYGSSETLATVEEASAAYAKAWQATHPDAQPVGVNDVSLRAGGKNKDHESHQNGLDLDLRLPRTDGTTGATTVRAKNYDREAAYAMLAAFGANERVERILFSDPVLLKRAVTNGEPWAYKLFDGGPVHTNHIHVDVKPPEVPES